MTNPWRVVVASLAGGDDEEVDVVDLAFTTALGEGGTASFGCPKRGPKTTRANLEPNQRQVKVYNANDLKWRGILGKASISGESDNVAFTAAGYFARLMDRYVDTDQVFTADEQMDIAWDLIADTQAKGDGDLGITRWTGETLSGITRTLTYLAADRPMIGQILKDLAGGDDGFDFEITPDLIWKTYHPKKGVQTDAVFELGKNIRSYSYAIDPAGMVTDLTAQGSGTADTKLLSVVGDATARTVFGLIEGVASFTDVDDQDLLDALAAQELANRKTPAEQPAITLKVDIDSDDTAFEVGDSVKVRIADGYLDVDAFFRVMAKTVSVGQDGQDNVSAIFEGES